MNIVLLGVSKDSLTLAHMIKNAENYPCNGLYIDGIYAKDVSKAASCAATLNVSAYTNIETAIRDADILFISCNDSELSKYSDFLKEHMVRNKILCHFSGKYDSSVLSCGVTNSVYSIRFPYSINMEKLPANTPVIVEGQGKHQEEFEAALKNSLKRVSFCTKNEKRIFTLAHRALTRYIQVIINLVIHLYKFAGIYSEKDFNMMLTNLIPEVASGNINVTPLDADETKKNMKLLSAMNYSDTKDLVRSMETHIVENSDCTFEEREELFRILKHKKY